MLSTILERSGLGVTFASLSARGSIWVPAAPAVQFADRAFDTPSGRIEIASAQAASDGLPRIPLPHADGRPAAGYLRLLSPAHDWLLNTSFGNVRKIARRLGPATIALHPLDAAERNLGAGQPALVHNDCGRLVLEVRICADIPRGVALAHKGRWLTLDAGRANVNVLNSGAKSDMGQSSAVHSVEVRVQPAPEAPPRPAERLAR
jgi:anaerobic selenocysteine-containing dehydrogenase